VRVPGSDTHFLFNPFGLHYTEVPLMVLRNHALLSIGSTLVEAFVRLRTLNCACEVQVATATLTR
jgi:hypothetical protein